MDRVAKRLLRRGHLRADLCRVSFPYNVPGNLEVLGKASVMGYAEDFFIRADVFLTVTALKTLITNNM